MEKDFTGYFLMTVFSFVQKKSMLASGVGE